MADDADGATQVRLWRYLPLAALTTASVVALPVMLVAALVPRGGMPLMAISAVATVAVSIAIAGVEAALWTRLARSRDLTFAELMLWGWVRRCWAERGLAERRDLYDSARKIGPTVSIDQLERLSRMLEARDSYTHGHSRRVARHAARIARAMRLPAEEIAKIRTAAAVHDVGKIYTPREILNNPGRLTDAEFEVVKRHPDDGAEMLATVGNPEIAAMVRHHHERVDGRGYPDALAGEDIPLGARIIAVADTFDALTSSRAYRGANTHRRALRVLSKASGSQLDRTAVAAFLRRYSSRRSIASFSLAAVAPQRILAALQSASSSLGVSAAGVTSILPALGASGLLALSPSLVHGGQPGGGTGHPEATLAVAPAQSAPATLTTPTSAAGTNGGARRRTGQSSPIAHLPQPPGTQTPTSGGGATGEGGGARGEGGGEQAASPAPSTGTQSQSPSSPGSSSQPPSAHGEAPPASPPAGTPAPSPGASVPGILAGTTATVTATASTAISGVTGTLRSTTEALSGSKPIAETTEALLTGTTEAVSETTGSLLSGLTKTLSGTTKTLPSSGSAGAPTSSGSTEATP